jgi:hypothetical protein
MMFDLESEFPASSGDEEQETEVLDMHWGGKRPDQVLVAVGKAEGSRSTADTVGDIQGLGRTLLYPKPQAVFGYYILVRMASQILSKTRVCFEINIKFNG